MDMISVGVVLTENLKRTYGFVVRNIVTTMVNGQMPGSIIPKQEESVVSVSDMTPEDWAGVISALEEMKRMAVKKMNENPELMEG